MLRVPLAAASCSNGEKHCSSKESGGDIMIVDGKDDDDDDDNCQQRLRLKAPRWSRRGVNHRRCSRVET